MLSKCFRSRHSLHFHSLWTDCRIKYLNNFLKVTLEHNHSKNTHSCPWLYEESTYLFSLGTYPFGLGGVVGWHLLKTHNWKHASRDEFEWRKPETQTNQYNMKSLPRCHKNGGKTKEGNVLGATANQGVIRVSNHLLCQEQWWSFPLHSNHQLLNE